MAVGYKTGGRTKGTPNKATGAAREAIAKFVDGNAHRLQEWLEAIAVSDGPKAAVQCYCDILEYHVPKLARTEIGGIEGGNPVNILATIHDERI